MISNKPLIILTGPTAVGKTDLSISLAKAINGAIVSADSMQVYKGMDIGSAKITREEMSGVPHYLIDVLEPTDDFNVVLFQKLAKEAINDIYSRGMIPIVTGGTGFYIQALIYDIDFSTGDDNDELRADLVELSKQDPDALYNRLLEVDPVSAGIIHKNNTKRIIRALEYFDQTGEPISAHNAREAAKTSAYNSAYFVLTMNRQTLYERIDKRVDIMVNSGLVEEVKALTALGLTKDDISMQGIGYRQVIDYLNGNMSLADTIDKIKLDTRHFAKRQLTWFRREKEVIWIDKDEFSDENEILAYMIKICEEKNIIL